MFNKIQKKKNEKTPVVSFDTLHDNYHSTEVATLYSIYNSVYSDKRFIENQHDMTELDLMNRRLVLEGMFTNRVKFLLDNAMYQFTDATSCYCPDLTKKYPFIYDIHSYMAEITPHTILDYTNLICTELYNSVMSHYQNSGTIELKEYSDTAMILLNNSMIKIYESLITLRFEACDIYFPAGIPDDNFVRVN